MAMWVGLCLTGCVEPHEVEATTGSSSATGEAVHSLEADPPTGTTVIGTSTGGGWTLRAQSTVTVIQGQSAGAQLHLIPQGAGTP